MYRSFLNILRLYQIKSSPSLGWEAFPDLILGFPNAVLTPVSSSVVLSLPGVTAWRSRGQFRVCLELSAIAALC